MEETNYSRAIIVDHETETQASGSEEGSPTATDEKVGPSSPKVKSTESSPPPKEKQKAHLNKIKLWQAADINKPNHLGSMAARPLIFLTFPVIFYAGFCYGSNLVWFNVLNGTASLVLGGEPYNFVASMVGLSYVSPLIGVAIGSLYTGIIGDKIVLWMARRNRGILEPEHRLWLFAPSLLLIPGGLILWGVGK